MNGWQRFGILLMCCFFIMVLFPDYGGLGWSFIGLVILMWTGAIMLISLICNVFALDRFEWFNRLLTLALFCGIVYTLLWYFPQEDKVSPINKLKYGEYPTMNQIKKGVKQLTFNFDFVHRNVRRDENFANQEEIEKAKKKVQNAAKKLKEKSDSFIEIIDEEAEEVLEN